ncbi:MAG: glyoxalase [Lewinellaceae bacterium]|nr:glyoxalase [Lewinellaceae bacterium]
MKIHSIKLETAHLSGVVDFYRSVLGLHTASVEPGTVHVQIGNSWLVFAENPGFRGIYHFAFNIPCNQIREGMAWLERSNIDLIANEKGEKQMDFANWHAEATYFFDPAGNIVELIARRDLQNESDRPFGHESLLEISEVGIVCPDVLAWSERAATEYGIFPFDKQKPSADFSALGRDTGLFIVVQEGRKWFLTDVPAVRVPLGIQFENDGGEMFDLQEG